MTPDKWNRLEEIYHSARTRDASDRAAYLDEACRNDESLRREIESLLAHGERLSELQSEVTLPAAAVLTSGAMVGPYRIEQRLDAGGMGTVYRAVDTRLGRQVAIKIGSAEFSDRFYREARAVAALNHPNVCTLHDIGSTPGIPGYLVMEFVDGPTLAARMESGPMAITEVLQIACQIAGALATAHERGIVHRDLKPANVKLTTSGAVKVLDFGLAKNFPGPSSPVADAAKTTQITQPVTEAQTAVGTILGTAAYMSPEQAAGKEADARSDIFSLGIVLYEMLCGRRPFTGPTTAEVITAILGAEPPSPRLLRRDIPEGVERILVKCLQKAPEGRYSSGKELEQDLEALLESVKTRFLSARSALVTAALLLAVIGGYFGWQTYRRRADLRWVNETAVPEIDRLSREHRSLAAATIYGKAERIAPDSKLLYTLAESVKTQPVKLQTTPPGATIYISDYAAAAGDNLSEWQKVGVAPVTTEVPLYGYYRLRAVKEGFAPTDQVVAAFASSTVDVVLNEKSSVPQGMVWVPPAPSTQILPSISLPGFWLDRYEVTNREFQQFVQMGGYTRQEYWKAAFVKDGRPLNWEQAVPEFHDLTARPGPANWILGAYPEGTANLPVAGVSWYEAMAYCEFAGKALPTVYEFRRAAPQEFVADVALMSNFSGKAAAPAGTYHGMNLFGSFDMAGNVAEWAANAAIERPLRFVLGGGWGDASYQYGVSNGLDPFARTISVGFRCVKRPNPPPPESFSPLQLFPPVLHTSTEKPPDDQTYRIFAAYHQYTPPKDLDAKISLEDSSSPYWTRQTVSFQAAYANDRVIAHLFLPKNATPPFQVILVMGGSDIMSTKRIEDYRFPYQFLILSGRAVVIPAYFGTLERGPSNWLVPPQDERDRSIKYSWDLSSTVDYLQTRSDIDLTKVGFYGISWGALHAPRLLAVDPRFKAAALVSGGFFPLPREVDPFNFASRYRVPTLMVNGKQDFFFPYETNQKVFFDALGTPIADKKQIMLDGGHVNPVARPDLLGEIIKWFDHYLGPVQER